MEADVQQRNEQETLVISASVSFPLRFVRSVLPAGRQSSQLSCFI